MIRVSIIGNGNVSHHLASAFSQSDSVELLQIYSRKGGDSSKIITDIKDLLAADIYIIAISDDAIGTLSATLPFSDKLVVHTSGSVPLNAIDPKNRRGVFYPLQTFSKHKPVDWSQIPLCIESQTESDRVLLEQLAKSISNNVYNLNSEQRKALHIAAVFASNFTNHMYSVANQICIEHNMPFDILRPLIAETANKITTLSPADAQTGPAIRHDQKTIASHLDLLTDQNQKNIYKTLTESIQHYGKKL